MCFLKEKKGPISLIKFPNLGIPHIRIFNHTAKIIAKLQVFLEEPIISERLEV